MGDNPRVMVYDELEVGEELPTLEFAIAEDLQGRYLMAVQDDNPWYYKESPWGSPVVHVSTLDILPMWAVTYKYEYPFGWVHARQETEFINPVPVGKPLRAVSKIAEKYRRKERGYIVVESLVVDGDGREIMRFRNHGMIDDERIRQARKSGLRSAAAQIYRRGK